jgi:hypothetical protein
MTLLLLALRDTLHRSGLSVANGGIAEVDGQALLRRATLLTQSKHSSYIRCVPRIAQTNRQKLQIL